MTRLTLDVSDELQQRLRERAAEAGLDSVEAYVRELLAADAAGVDPGAPSSRSVESEEELESVLLARLEDARPSTPASPDFWDALRRRARGEPDGRP